MGQPDPLDGVTTGAQLGATARRLHPGGPSLAAAAADFARLLAVHLLPTADPLGLGGLLTDAFRLQQLPPQNAPDVDDLLAPAALAPPADARPGALQQAAG